MRRMETPEIKATASSPRTWGDAVSRRFWYLESERLCAAARQKTGLEDFSDPPIEPVLALLTTSLEEEANLHPLGRFLMWIHVRGLLETRLKLAELWRSQSSEQN